MPDEEKKMLQSMMKLVQRMENLLSDLLNYSRIGRVNLSFQETDMNKVIQSIIDDFFAETAKGVKIIIDNPLPKMIVDYIRIGELFRNLIENGIKYNLCSQKEIHIGSESTEEGDLFYVSDNGIGIPIEHLDSIFTIFKRLHREDEYGGGSGAGLTIVKKIVDRHHGKITVKSNEGVGTRFEILLKSNPQARKVA